MVPEGRLQTHRWGMRPPRALPQAKLGATNVIVFMFMTTKLGRGRRKEMRPAPQLYAAGIQVACIIMADFGEALNRLDVCPHSLSA